MNKVILGLILAVCILGMALVMLNERLGRKNDYSPPPMAESGFSQDTSVVPEKVDIPTPTETYKSSREIAENVIAREREQARAALAPLLVQEAAPGERMTSEQEREALRLAAGVQLESEAETPDIPPSAAKPRTRRSRPQSQRCQNLPRNSSKNRSSQWNSRQNPNPLLNSRKSQRLLRNSLQSQLRHSPKSQKSSRKRLKNRILPRTRPRKPMSIPNRPNPQPQRPATTLKDLLSMPAKTAPQCELPAMAQWPGEV